MKKRIRKKLNRGEFTQHLFHWNGLVGSKDELVYDELFFSEIETNPPGVLIFIEDRLDGGVFDFRAFVCCCRRCRRKYGISLGTTDERRQSFVEWLSRSGVRDRLQIYDDNVGPLIPIPGTSGHSRAGASR